MKQELFGFVFITLVNTMAAISFYQSRINSLGCHWLQEDLQSTIQQSRTSSGLCCSKPCCKNSTCHILFCTYSCRMLSQLQQHGKSQVDQDLVLVGSQVQFVDATSTS